VREGRGREGRREWERKGKRERLCSSKISLEYAL